MSEKDLSKNFDVAPPSVSLLQFTDICFSVTQHAVINMLHIVNLQISKRISVENLPRRRNKNKRKAKEKLAITKFLEMLTM